MSDRKWNYFSEEEVKNQDSEHVAKLDAARHRSGIPYIITSGYRTPEHNFAVGGVENSAHTKGLANDLKCTDSHSLWKLLDGIFSVGFKRIGVYFQIKTKCPSCSHEYYAPANNDTRIDLTHVHCDSDQEKPQEVVFLKVKP